MLRSIRTFLVVALLAGLGILLLSDRLIQTANNYTYTELNKIPANPVGLLLGTARYLPNKGGENPYFTHRIQAAVALYQQGKINYVLVSGDNQLNNYNEPREMRRALMDAGIPAQAIYSDYAGFRTLDSIVRTKEVFGQRRFTVISQAFHNARAIYIARHLGLDVVGFNAQDVKLGAKIPIRLREILARFACLLDLYILQRQPKFLGEPVTIGQGALPYELQPRITTPTTANTP